MATFNGTQIDDVISGTNDDDIITGLDGNDVINGAAGNDTITGGEGADDMLGGGGNDTFIIEAASELIDLGADGLLGGGDDTFDDIKGGADVDTLVTSLLDGDDITNNGSAGTIWGVTGVLTNNLELVQVTNASDTILTLGTDSIFAFDGQSRTSTDFATSGVIDVVAASFVSNAVTADDVTFDALAGITIDGTTYVAGDSFSTASGGTVNVTFDGASNNWELEYTGPAADGLAVITAETTVEEQTLSVTATEAVTGNTVSTDIVLNNIFGTNVDLDIQGALTATKVIGSDNNNFLTSGAGNDTIIGNGGGDTISLFDGNNKTYAGATDDAGDAVYVYGDGNNIVGTGVGVDSVIVFGSGSNTIFGGADGDNFTFIGAGAYSGATGANTVWGGADSAADTFSVQVGADGDNILGGGMGADSFTIDGGGDNTMYLGADDDNDTVTINGGGDNIVYGGAGTSGTGHNSINIYGTGANTVYNGNGDDFVYVGSSATSNNMLWGGAGDDTFTFAAGVGSSGTVAIAAGNGVDTINGFKVDGETKLDVTELGMFTDASDVLNSMSESDVDGDTNTDVVLFIAPGEAVVFDDMNLIDFQLADPADWLVV